MALIGLGAAGGLAVVARDGIVGGIAYDEFKKWVGYLPDEVGNASGSAQDLSNLAKSLFGGSRSLTKFVGGYAHHKYPNECHPDDRIAIESVVACARALCAEQRYELEPQTASDDGSFVCTGSPVSNEITRRFLQYEYKDARKPDLGLRRVRNPRINLPFEFILDPQEIKRVAKTNRIHSPDGVQVSTNWLLRKHTGEYLVPDTKNKRKDYLIVTRIPNWRENDAGGNVVTMVGGTHGVATNAVKLLLKDGELLEHLQFIAKRHRYWQAVLEVDRMEYQQHPYSPKTRRLMAVSLAKKIDYQNILV